MRILLTNDDGVSAPGIQALYQALRSDCDVWLVAPDCDRSGLSHALTLNRPIGVNRLSRQVIAIDGTPADCVRLGFSNELLPSEPDLVISGINRGFNLADDVLYSGTVGAAREGCVFGKPSLACSSSGHQDIKREAKIIAGFVKWWLDHLELSFINLNIPNQPASQLKGWVWLPMHRRQVKPALIKSCNPRLKEQYWIDTPGPVESSNAHLLADHISLTPLQLDATDQHVLKGCNSLDMPSI
jgi:5'-nucleotidase